MVNFVNHMPLLYNVIFAISILEKKFMQFFSVFLLFMLKYICERKIKKWKLVVKIILHQLKE